MTESERIALLTSDAKQGDRDAFNALYTAYGKRVFYFCRSLLGAESASAEVTRDVFVYAWHNIHSLPDGQSFYRWVCGNAFYFAKIAMAGLRGNGLAVTEPEEIPDDMDEPSPAPATEPSIRRADLETATELLLGLQDNERICVLLKEYIGFPDREAAGIAGCSEEALRYYAQTGKQSICRGLAERLPEHPDLTPFFGRLLRTCGRNCNLPDSVTEGLRAELDKPEEALFPPPGPKKPEKKKEPFPTRKQLTVLCVILGVLLVGALAYIVYWFVSDPSESQPTDTSSQVSQVIGASEPSEGTESQPEPNSTESEAESEDVSQPEESSESEVSVPAVSQPEVSEPNETSTTVSEPVSQPPAPETPAELPRTTDNLRMRSQPDTSDPDNILCQIPKNSHIEILETVTGADGKTWYKASYTNRSGTRFEGYCSADYVQTAE